MSAESGWAAAIGLAVGTLGWVVGLGGVVWPEHPQWALLFIIVGVTTVCMAFLKRKEGRNPGRAHS